MFVIPTVISTIADIISVIDIALKYSGALSKNVKKVIEKSSAEIKTHESPLSLEGVSEILNNQLKIEIPENELLPVTKSLSDYFEMIEGTAKHLETFSKNNRMVNYGDILFNLILRTGEKLDKWGCFNKWTEDLPLTIPKIETPGLYLANYLLLAPTLTNTFWENNELRSQIKQKYKNLKLFYLKSYSLIHANPLQPASIFGGLWMTNKTYFRNLNIQKLEYADLFIQSNYISITYTEPLKTEKLRLSDSIFVSLISATLGDFFNYSMKVNKELETSNSLIIQLRNKKNAA